MKIFRRRGGAHCREADRERIRRGFFAYAHDARPHVTHGVTHGSLSRDLRDHRSSAIIFIDFVDRSIDPSPLPPTSRLLATMSRR